MSGSEGLYQFGRWDYLVFAVFIAIYLFLVLTNKLPSIESFSKFVAVFNSVGGNILLLALFTFYAIRIAMRMFYHLLNLSEAVMSKDQAIVTAVIAFVTGTLVGNFSGALLKTMTGAGGTPAQETKQPTPPETPPPTPEVKP